MKKDTIKTELLFEPLTTGVRCAAIDEKGRTLWGYVASKQGVRDIHQLVAVYDQMMELVESRLGQHGFIKAKDANQGPTVEDIRDLLDKAIEVLSKMKSSYSPSNITTGRETKLGKAGAIRTTLSDMLTNLELIQRQASSAEKGTTDELRFD